MFKQEEFLEELLELVKEGDICLSSFTSYEDRNMHVCKTLKRDVKSFPGFRDINVDLTFTGCSDKAKEFLGQY